MGKNTPWFVNVTLVLAALTPCVALLASLGFFVPSWMNKSELIVDDLSIQLHTLNLVVIFTDFAYSRVPLYFAHAWLPTVYALAYVLFTYVYYLAGGMDYKG